jgi:hypothetical protein
MTNQIIIFLSLFYLLLSSYGCNKNKNCQEDNFPKTEKWFLYRDTITSKHGSWPRNGYFNEKGDTMIPLDKYFCTTDTFEYYGVVMEITNGRLIGIDKNGKELFEAVPSGEGFYPFEEKEGRIMITKNGKYGFANHKGEIVIEPKYTCAESFSNGKAKVSFSCTKMKGEYLKWKMDSAFYIDRCGNVIN